MCQTISFASVSRVKPSREVVAKHFAWRIFMCNFLTLHPYYIYLYYPQMQNRLFREKNPRLVFHNTHTHLFERELLILSEKLLQPLLHPSPIIIPWEEIYTQKKFTHFQSVVSVLELLGSIGRSQGWQMQHGACYGIRRAR